MKMLTVFFALVLGFAAVSAAQPNNIRPDQAISAPDATPVPQTPQTPAGQEPITPLFAGPNTRISVNFQGPIDVPQTIEALVRASELDLRVTYLELPSTPLTGAFQMTDQPAVLVIGTMLNRIGFQSRYDDATKVMVVWRQTTNPLPVQPTPQLPAAAPHPAPQTSVMTAGNDPLAEFYRRRSMARSIDEFNAMVGQIAMVENYYMRPIAQPGYLYAGYYPRPDYGHQLPLLGMMWKGCLSGPSGRIKFKYDGPSDERILWEISLNGEIQGSLDQGDSFFNSIDVCAGHAQVVIEKRGTPGRRLERSYSVRPGSLTEITVGDILFGQTPTP